MGLRLCAVVKPRVSTGGEWETGWGGDGGGASGGQEGGVAVGGAYTGGAGSSGGGGRSSIGTPVGQRLREEAAGDTKSTISS